MNIHFRAGALAGCLMVALGCVSSSATEYYVDVESRGGQGDDSGPVNERPHRLAGA